MIEYELARINKLIYHRLHDVESDLAPELNDSVYFRADEAEDEALRRIFLKPFNQVAQTQEFTHSVSLELNPLFSLCKSIELGQDFVFCSKGMAKHLHDVSRHPAIPGGDLFVIHFQDVTFGNAVYDAVGIYKIENKDFFIETSEVITGETGLRFRKGIGSKKFEKALLVLFSEDVGYTLLPLEKAGGETEYWTRDFVGAQSKNDHINHTNAVLSLTKNFVTQQYPEEFEINKADQIDLLNRSVAFFRKNDTFDKRNFEEEVLQDAEVIRSFHQYNKQYSEEVNWELADHFEISQQAVKKQQRIFKSVLKLDKNFHIYIHGNRSLIEQGTDADGRKYYKIYYENEA